MVKAKDRRNTPGYEVREIDETIRRLLDNIDSVALSITHFANVVRHEEDPDDCEWDWSDAGRLSSALCSLKDVCRLLDIECKTI